MYFSSMYRFDFVDIARRSFARGYNYVTTRCARLSATAGLSCVTDVTALRNVFVDQTRKDLAGY